MMTKRFLNSRRTVLATAIACALSLGALPVLAANSAPANAPSTPAIQQTVDPGLMRIAMDTGQTLTDTVHTALVHLTAGDTAQARLEVRKGLRLTEVLDRVMPFASVPAQVDKAKQKVNGQSLEEFQRDMVPIAANLGELEVYAPESAAKARKHLADARSHKQAGDTAGAEKSLDLMSDDVIAGTAFLPVSVMRDQLKSADKALTGSTPDTKAAETALNTALDSITLVVDDVGLPTDPATLAKADTTQTPPYPVAGTAYDVSVQPVPFISGGVGKAERQSLEHIDKAFNLKLVFARGNGEYLSQVKVAIRDSKGAPVLEETANGPWFLADLAPGTYTVTATGFGKRFERTVHVPARGQERELFSWS